MLRFLATLVIVFSAWNTAWGQEEVAKQFPPYPDVWGYDLSEYELLRERKAHLMAYVMPDGDIAFVFPVSEVPYKEKDGRLTIKNDKWLLLKFFAQEKTFLTVDQLDEVTKNTKYISFIGNNNIKLSNGTVVKKDIPLDSTFCRSNNLLSSLTLKDSSEKTIKKVSIISGYDKPLKQKGSTFCEGERGEAYIYKQLYFLPRNIIKLEDDSMLVFSGDGTLIVRLTKDLTTPFKPVTPIDVTNGRKTLTNLFILPYETIEKLHSEVPSDSTSGEQGLHDGIVNYLIEHKY